MKRLAALLLILVLCLTSTAALGEGEVNAVTIQEWLNAKGDCGDCLIVAVVDEVINPMLAVICDETASVHLFAEVSAAEICDGDVLLLHNPAYNEYEGEIEMAFPEIVRRVYTSEISASKRMDARQYEFEASPDEEITISDTVFHGDVSVSGVGQLVIFRNCRFEGNLINCAPELTKIYICYDCEFADGAHCIIDSGVREANLYYETPKFVLEKYVEIESSDLGGVIAMGDGDIVFNGKTYGMDDLQLIQKADGSVVDYEEGMESSCSMHAVMHWWENGEEVLVTAGIE